MAFERGALLYLDDDWTKDVYTYKHGLANAYDRTIVASGTRVTTASSGASPKTRKARSYSPVAVTM